VSKAELVTINIFQKKKKKKKKKKEISGEGTADGTEHRPPGWHADYTADFASVTGLLPDFDSPNALGAYHTDIEEAAAAAVQVAGGDPKSLHEAQSHSDWPSWKKAMDRELSTLKQAGTWETVPCLKDKNVIDCKWVYRTKYKSDGAIDKHKARLVARGFTQVYGVDYLKTYSPVAKLASLRTILVLTACLGWDIICFDFNAAYLNGELEELEEIYMEQAPGYAEGGAGFIKRLKKVLYGLKQAGHRWYDTFARELADLGFYPSAADPGVFFAQIGNHILILPVHVDDCTLTGSSNKLIAQYKTKLDDKFPLTDLGPIHWLLGIEVTCDHDAHTISLCQSSFIDTILARFSLADTKPYGTPMVPSTSYSKHDSPSSPADVVRMRKVPYREAIGSLMYIAIATRPDISFAVSCLSQFLENPGEAHWQAVKCVFRYLAGTRDQALTYGTEQHELQGYTDADGTSQEHRHAISRYAFIIDGGAVSWSLQKQELVTLSTAEAEYVVATHAAKECIWLHRLTGKLFPSLHTQTTLFCDNQAALKLATDDNYHARTKHIDIRFHFIRQVISSGAINMVYCPTDDMMADILTKVLPRWKVMCHSLGLGLRQLSRGVVKSEGNEE